MRIEDVLKGHGVGGGGKYRKGSAINYKNLGLSFYPIVDGGVVGTIGEGSFDIDGTMYGRGVNYLKRKVDSDFNIISTNSDHNRGYLNSGAVVTSNYVLFSSYQNGGYYLDRYDKDTLAFISNITSNSNGMYTVPTLDAFENVYVCFGEGYRSIAKFDVNNTASPYVFSFTESYQVGGPLIIDSDSGVLFYREYWTASSPYRRPIKSVNLDGTNRKYVVGGEANSKNTALVVDTVSKHLFATGATNDTICKYDYAGILIAQKVIVDTGITVTPIHARNGLLFASITGSDLGNYCFIDSVTLEVVEFLQSHLRVSGFLNYFGDYFCSVTGQTDAVIRLTENLIIE